MASLNATASNRGGDMIAKGNQIRTAAELVANKLKVPKIFDSEIGDARSERSDHLKGKSKIIFFVSYYRVQKRFTLDLYLINEGSDKSNFKLFCLLQIQLASMTPRTVLKDHHQPGL